MCWCRWGVGLAVREQLRSGVIQAPTGHLVQSGATRPGEQGATARALVQARTARASGKQTPTASAAGRAVRVGRGQADEEAPRGLGRVEKRREEASGKIEEVSGTRVFNPVGLEQFPSELVELACICRVQHRTFRTESAYAKKP